LKRDGPKGSASFKQITWEEALDEAASKLEFIVEEYGGEAVLNMGAADPTARFSTTQTV
jgi:anaerobic selenocysteine-containing dehydrogenase